MNNIWRINYSYDHSEPYEDFFTKTEVWYVEGSKEQVQQYLANKTGYDPNNLIDFDVEKEDNEEDGLVCPTIIANDYGADRLTTVKATYNSRERKYIFYRNAANIVYATINDDFDTEEFIAVPVTLDDIITKL